jgi:hypothetical protein
MAAKSIMADGWVLSNERAAFETTIFGTTMATRATYDQLYEGIDLIRYHGPI